MSIDGRLKLLHEQCDKLEITLDHIIKGIAVEEEINLLCQKMRHNAEFSTIADDEITEANKMIKDLKIKKHVTAADINEKLHAIRVLTSSKESLAGKTNTSDCPILIGTFIHQRLQKLPKTVLDKINEASIRIQVACLNHTASSDFHLYTSYIHADENMHTIMNTLFIHLQNYYIPPQGHAAESILTPIVFIWLISEIFHEPSKAMEAYNSNNDAIACITHKNRANFVIPDILNILREVPKHVYGSDEDVP